MSRFNRWETEYLRSLHPQNRLERFFVLFEMARTYDDQKKAKMHDEHLKNLVETQKRLKRGHRRDKMTCGQ
jgi:hypothetical protein